MHPADEYVKPLVEAWVSDPTYTCQFDIEEIESATVLPITPKQAQIREIRYDIASAARLVMT
ncbi:hypothetical protein SP39_18 [Salmonella phage 39]|nr:hypothetical protein SP39_18 [Salmonella phage 39]